MLKIFDAKIILLHVIPEIPIPPTLLNVGKIFRSRKAGGVISSREYMKLYSEMKEEALKMIKKNIKEYDTDIDIRVLIGSQQKMSYR